MVWNDYSEKRPCRAAECPTAIHAGSTAQTATSEAPGQRVSIILTAGHDTRWRILHSNGNLGIRNNKATADAREIWRMAFRYRPAMPPAPRQPETTAAAEAGASALPFVPVVAVFLPTLEDESRMSVKCRLFSGIAVARHNPPASIQRSFQGH